jgi:gamma-tubulin complex component 3
MIPLVFLSRSRFQRTEGDTQRFVIPPPTRTLLHRLAEVGHLYTRVDTFVRSHQTESSSTVGMIEQSLCHHLQAQMTEYYRLIAVLESQMAFSTKNDEDDRENAREEESGLTLKRLDVWINEWRLRMRMMSVCVEGARGALLSLIPRVPY